MASTRPWSERAVEGDRGLLQALRGHRAVRAGLSQILASLAALALGLLLPKLDQGPQVSAGAAQPFLFAVAGGLVSFIALVFSLLFLLVQFATTAFTPRLTIFRDDPRVWRAFAVFLAAFVYSATAGLQIGSDPRTTALVPAVAMALVLTSLALARNLQMRALRLLQMNTTLDELRSRGVAVLDALYTAPAAPAPPARPALPPVTQSVRWERPGALLQQIDLPELRRVALEAGAVVRLGVPVGGELRRGAVVLTVHGGPTAVAEDLLLDPLRAGPDRTFAQDPLLAFRLLSDIAIRSLSSAVNDPASAVSAIAALEDLLLVVVDRELDVGWVSRADGSPLVVLAMPTWEDFVAAAIDDLQPYTTSAPMAAARLGRLVDDLRAIAPACRRAALEERRDVVEGGAGCVMPNG